MNTPPDNAALIDRLAAEYVLGTLRGAARRRLQRWRDVSVAVDERCRFWEERLMPLLQSVKPIQPPGRVWEGIRNRLKLTAGVRPRTGVRNLALAASVLLLIAAATLFFWRTFAPGRAMEVATISSPSGTLMWRVEILGKPGAAGGLSVLAGALASRPAGHDYELWALPKSGKPVSLGLLPYEKGTLRRALTASQQQALAVSAQLAVSVEPVGGSPTGQPTGAVVFVVPLRVVS